MFFGTGAFSIGLIGLEQVKAMNEFSDGVIVGSHLVRMIAKADGDAKKAAESIAAFIKEAKSV